MGESDFLEMDLTKGKGKTYRYWQGTPPLYTFGYGLSYTEFKFTKGKCEAPEDCVDIRNIGHRAGHETIFVFVNPPQGNIGSSEPASKMEKFLVQFEKFYLEKGETETYRFTLNKSRDLTMYDRHGETELFAGEYRLEFSNGVDQIISDKVLVS